MIVTTTSTIAGKRITKTYGQVFGVVVRSRGIAGNIAASLRTPFGGEIHEYRSLAEDSRRQAMDRMSRTAGLMGANAVVRMMFESSEMGKSMTEVVAYGTAVTVADAPVSVRWGVIGALMLVFAWILATAARIIIYRD